MPNPVDHSNAAPDATPHASHAYDDLHALLAEVQQLTRQAEMPRRIELCRAALAQVQRESQPEWWAGWHVRLADSLIETPLGSIADNLEQAIEHCQHALEVNTRQALPEQWAETIHTLATAYRERIRGERAQNIEQAIDLYQQALQIRTRQAFPEKWAMTTHWLAYAYSDRIRGERAQNIEQAIELYQQALKIRTREAFPKQWARTMNGLARAYYKHIRGEQAENIEQAIALYQQALQIYTRQTFPEKWGIVMNNFANAYKNRIRGERAENIEQAIALYQQTLQVHTRQAFPFDWAMAMNNLANAYFQRSFGLHEENITEAIALYEELLQVWTEESFPYYWAMVQYNLGGAYEVHGSGVRVENIAQAIACYQGALRVRRPHALPQDCRDTAYQLGRLLYEQGRWVEARQALGTAHEALEVLRRETVSLVGKQSLVEKNEDLYRRLVACSLRARDGVAAFAYAVAGKGRLFMDLLAFEHLQLTGLAEEHPQLEEEFRQEAQLQRQVDRLRVQLQGESSGREAQRQREAMFRELQRAQDLLTDHQIGMTERYPAFMATQSVPALSMAQAQQLAVKLKATLVEYVRHAEGWCAFVVTAQRIRHVPLPEVDKELLAEIELWTSEIESRFARGDLSYEPLYEWYSELIQPLKLPKSRRLVIAPFGVLHRMPFAALRKAENRPYLAQRYRLSLVPSLGALRVTVNQQQRHGKKRQPAQQLLSVAYPGEPRLPNVLPEAKAIAEYFPQVTPLHNEAATPDAVLEAAKKKDIIHFGCHGGFDMENPTQSGLQLAQGWLTVQRILTHLPLTRTQLVTLAACQSGQSAIQRGDEQVGLIQALMSAGANAVVASLWNVHDEATRALFEAFYGQLMSGSPPVAALQQAQQAIRTRWPHPYFWASFAISGLAHHPISPSAPAPDLTTRLDELKEESQQRGGPPMNKERIIEDSRVILDQITHYQAQLEAAFAEDQTSAVIFATLLAELTRKARHIQNEADLLAIAHAIQTLVEETPPLRQLLMDEEGTQLSRAQATRSATINKHHPNPDDDRRALEQTPTLTQELLEINMRLVQILPSAAELAAQDPTFNAKLDDTRRKMDIFNEEEEDEDADAEQEQEKGWWEKIVGWFGGGG